MPDTEEVEDLAHKTITLDVHEMSKMTIAGFRMEWAAISGGEGDTAFEGSLDSGAGVGSLGMFLTLTYRGQTYRGSASAKAIIDQWVEHAKEVIDQRLDPTIAWKKRIEDSLIASDGKIIKVLRTGENAPCTIKFVALTGLNQERIKARAEQLGETVTWSPKLLGEVRFSG